MDGEPKTDEGHVQGKIVEIDHERGCGRILATDHRLISFHRTAVVDGAFEDLKTKDSVALVVPVGERGTNPRATRVRAVGTLDYDPKIRV
ncbi:hypothetical protein [Stappia sp.]|uniref:hypothetical protein n=1 Tax=Stappia sp. TaxID=1870903 RepID=UPI0032D95FE6